MANVSLYLEPVYVYNSVQLCNLALMMPTGETLVPFTKIVCLRVFCNQEAVKGRSEECEEVIILLGAVRKFPIFFFKRTLYVNGGGV